MGKLSEHKFQWPTTIESMHPRILIVDDDDASATIARLFLKQHGYLIDVATHLRQALRLLSHHQYHLIFLDIRLRYAEEGLHLLKTLRALPEYAQIPIVAFTAYAYVNAKEFFLEHGFDAYLEKPFSRKQILQTAQRLLASRWCVN